METTGRVVGYDSDFVVTATFESTWQAHEACPAMFTHYNDDYGQCDVHDEFWRLSGYEEMLDL